MVETTEEILRAAAPLIAQRLRGGGSPGKGKGELFRRLRLFKPATHAAEE